MSALREGKTIAPLAQEKNVSIGTLVNAIVAKARLDQAVVAGKLTQAQMDALLKVAQVMAPSYPPLPQEFHESSIRSPYHLHNCVV